MSIDGEPTHVGELIRQFRKRAGLSQRELAQQAGLSTAAIRDLEQGRTRQPRRESLRALAVALGLDATETASILADSTPGEQPQEVADEPLSGPVRIGVLGPLRITARARQIAVRSAKRRLLLARLALDPGEPVRNEELASLLWPDDEPRGLAKLLSTHIARLRLLLGRSAVHIEPTATGYRLSADPETLDLLQFRSLVADAGDKVAQQQFDLLAAAV